MIWKSLESLCLFYAHCSGNIYRRYHFHSNPSLSSYWTNSSSFPFSRSASCASKCSIVEANNGCNNFNFMSHINNKLLSSARQLLFQCRSAAIHLHFIISSTQVELIISPFFFSLSCQRLSTFLIFIVCTSIKHILYTQNEVSSYWNSITTEFIALTY